jgi:hypothetical protein
MVRIASVCDTLDVLAQLYSAMGIEIASTQGLWRFIAGVR